MVLVSTCGRHVTRVWTDEEVARIWRDQRYRAAFERLGIPYPDPPVPYVKADLSRSG